MKVYIGSSYESAGSKGVHATGELIPQEFDSFRTFYDQYFKKCQQGTKVGYGPGTYFTIAKEIENTPGDPAGFALRLKIIFIGTMRHNSQLSSFAMMVIAQ